MGVSEVELLLQKHVSQRDKSFQVSLSGRPPRGGWRLWRQRSLSAKRSVVST